MHVVQIRILSNLVIHHVLKPCWRLCTQQTEDDPTSDHEHKHGYLNIAHYRGQKNSIRGRWVVLPVDNERLLGVTLKGGRGGGGGGGHGGGWGEGGDEGRQVVTEEL